MYPLTLNPVVALGTARDLKWCNLSGPWESARNVGTWTLLGLVNCAPYFRCGHSEKPEAGRREDGLHHVVSKE